MFSKNFLRISDFKIVFFWLVFVIYSALVSYGYYHPDEFGHISSFLNFKLGLIPDSELFWDYEKKIRPWIQIGFYYLFAEPLNIILKLNHYQIERLTLVLNLILSVFTIYLFLNWFFQNTKSKSEKYWPLFLLFSIWFLPSMIIRHSSESFSMLLLFIAIYIFVHGKSKVEFLASGLLSGISFWARFQMGFFIAGFWIFGLMMSTIRKEKKFFSYILMSLGILAAFGIGVLTDYWGYGEWTLTPWNYYEQNVIQNKATQWGTEPWYWYFEKSASFLLLPHLWLLLPISIFLIRHRTDLLAISGGLLIFFLAHILSPHKETRFIYPMILFVFLIFSFAFINSEKRKVSIFFKSKWTWKPFVILNFILLIGYTLTANTQDRFKIIPALRELPKKSRIYFSSYVFSASANGRAEGNRVPIVPGYTKPEFLKAMRVHESEYESLCMREPNSFLVLNSQDSITGLYGAEKDQLLLDIDIPAVWQSHPQFLKSEKGWYKKLLRWKIIECKSFTNYTNSDKS